MFDSLDHEQIAEEPDSNSEDKNAENFLPVVFNDEQVSTDLNEQNQMAEIVVKEEMKDEILAEAFDRTPSSSSRKRTKKIKVIVDERKRGIRLAPKSFLEYFCSAGLSIIAQNLTDRVIMREILFNARSDCLSAV